MNKTIAALRELFLSLYKEQESDWSYETIGRKPSRIARKVWEYQSWPPIQQRELEKWLSISDELDEFHVDFTEKRRFLYLPPLEKNADFVPILSLKCTLNETKTAIRLHVMLISHGGDEQPFHGIGFRLDSPESQQQNEQDEDDDEEEKKKKNKDGRHDFYHAQLIRGFGWGPNVENPDWLPCTQPSFPLLADDPVTLVFALLLTLYGKKYCRDFYIKHSSNLPDLGRYMEKLQPWIKWKSLIDNGDR